MCGIAGVVGQAELNPALRSSLQQAMRKMERRGPDAEGLSTWPRAYLGHRRLSILDLSPLGAQPMLSDDGRVGLVFNGCIYNFLELRAQLEAAGYRFKSQCDTEVLLHGYRHWGVEGMAPRLRGMFAFGIWDDAAGEFYLVRDRFGVKPVVYAESGTTFFFASTVAALEEISPGSELNPSAVLELLEHGYIGNSQSIYRNFRKLPPASILKWRAGQTAISTYWSLPTYDEASRITFDEAVEESERLIVDAVRLRLQADVKVGALLSGGIDSSLVCWAMSKLNADIEAFTIGAAGHAMDESAAAREIAQHLGIRHRVIDLGDLPAPSLDTLTAAYGEPFADQSAMGMLRVSEEAKRFATVVLTGDGGDESYLGYPFLQTAWTTEQWARRLPAAATSLWPAMRSVLERVPALRRAVSFGDYTTGGLGPLLRRRPGLRPLIEGGAFGPLLAGQLPASREIAASRESARHLLTELSRYHWDSYLTGSFTTKVDGATMFHSVEARSPFLDHVLWDFAATLPPRVRFQGGQTKAVLREIARRHVGAQTASRPKQGFDLPLSNWLLRPGSAALWDRLRSQPLVVEGGWMKQQGLSTSIDRALSLQKIPDALWHVVVFEHWLAAKKAAQLHPALIDAR